MIKKIINIDNPAYLSAKLEQLIINFKDEEKASETIPFEEIGVLIFNNMQITASAVCLSKLNEYKAALVICDDSHLPSGLMLAFDGNFEQTERIKKQINLKLVNKKQAWAQIIRTKINNQSILLELLGKDFQTLRALKDKVQSGDKTNREAVAAKYYWGYLFDNHNFYRDRYGPYPNNMLNYGYAILRAITARSIVAAGLHPSIGLHHHNQYNSYCLADDLMEPFRPFVDYLVLRIFEQYPEEVLKLPQEIRKKLLNIAFVDSEIDGIKHPLQNSVQITANSLFKFINGKTKKLDLPNLCEFPLTE